MIAVRRLAIGALGLVLSTHAVASISPDEPAVDAAFTAFWTAPTPEAAGAASAAILSTGVSFDEGLRRLKVGRPYQPDVPTGVVLRSRTADGQEFPYSLDVPAAYQPSRRYQVRFQLHGGVGSGEDNRRRGSGAIGALAGDEQIYVLPTAWLDMPWWSEGQVHNIRAILDDLKRHYNVDENRVVLAGVSDGGTGAFYVAMRDPTPFAGFLSLNGFLMELAGRKLALGDLFPNNFRRRRHFTSGFWRRAPASRAFSRIPTRRVSGSEWAIWCSPSMARGWLATPTFQQRWRNAAGPECP